MFKKGTWKSSIYNFPYVDIQVEMYVKCVCMRINGSILYYRIMPISDIIGCQTKNTA